MTLAAMITRLFLSVLLLRAALHKLRDRKIFQAQLGAYQLLPSSLLSTASAILIAGESATSVILMNPAWTTGLWLAALLFLLYALAMMINLMKGVTNISCGCDGPFAAKKTISWSLVLRNLLLTILALLCTVSVNRPSLHTFDLFIILAGVSAFLLIYEAIGQAIANSQHYRQWQSQQAGTGH
jgi:hypothetical protein